MRRKESAPVVTARAQPRMRWKTRASDLQDGALVDQLFVAGHRVGEVVPVAFGNPRRGALEGYIWHTYPNAELGIGYHHTGDGGGLYSRDRAGSRVGLVEYVQGCLRQRGMRP